jgi:hypothetical protein
MHFPKGDASMAQRPRPAELQNILQICAEHHRKYVAVMLAGGFVSFLPGLIESEWDDVARWVAGLPLAISFCGLPPDLDRQPVPFALTSSYWINAATYWETDQARGVHYRTRPAGDYRVSLLYMKRTQSWAGRKYRGEQLLVEATGRHIWEFIINFTGQGREEDEPAQAFLTCEDVAALRVYVWVPPGR